jgi:hypothetical protein
MKKIAIIAGALALSGCTLGGGVNTAGTVALQTRAAADDFYRHASAAGEDLVKAGILDKATYKARDAQAYAILLKVRAFQQLASAASLITGGR